MAALTLDIVGRTLLGIDLSDRSSTIRESLKSALARFGKVGSGVFLGRGSAGLGRTVLRRRRGPGSHVPSAAPTPYPAESALHAIVEQVISAAQGHASDDRGDVVSALLSEGDIRDGMSSAEIHDHVLTLMMAGHETTANALTWTVFLLGKHPEVQDRLHDEVRDFAYAGPTFTDLPELSYTRAVVAEAMRLYPPAWFLGRTILAAPGVRRLAPAGRSPGGSEPDVAAPRSALVPRAGPLRPGSFPR